MYYITNTRENANNRQLRDFNTNTYTLETLVLFCAVWTRKEKDGTIYHLRNDQDNEDVFFPVWHTVYVNGQRASAKDLSRLYHRRLSGSVGIDLHATRNGLIAFNTDD